MPPSPDKNSRVLRLIFCLGLIGGIGCISAHIMTPEEQIAANNAMAEHNRQTVEKLQNSADAGDVLATTRLGIYYVNGSFGLSKDEEKGMLLLDQAAARHYAPAEYTLGWLYLEGRSRRVDARHSPAPTYLDSARGIALLKQSASRACSAAPINAAQTAFQISALYRQGRQIAADPDQADLWRARSILHCGYPSWQTFLFDNPNQKTITSQAQIDAMTLLLLMPPSVARTKLQGALTPEAMQTATDRAEALRRAVADSEKQYPAPPHSGKP